MPPLRLRARAAMPALALLLTISLVTLPAVGQDGEGGDPSTSQSRFQAEGDTYVVDLTFPLPEGSGYHYPDTYDSPRGGDRLHRATDIMADKMVSVHAVADGVICYAPGIDEAMPSYGYMIRLCGDDGFRYAYVHLNNDTPGSDDGMGGPENAYAPGIEEGTRVQRGDHIGWVGDSGNAESTGSHLHFEIAENGGEGDVRVNPYNSLQAAEERGDFPSSIAPAPPTPSPGPTDPGDDDGDDDSGSDPAGEFTRLAGTTRLTTAVALSLATRSSARAVIIVPADSHVEALVAAPLAGVVDAPILLSGPDGLDDAVMAEIRRLGAPSAYIIGSEDQLSPVIAEDLAAAGVRNSARVSATDAYALSVAVAEEILTYPGFSALDQVILALGGAEDPDRDLWPDALSASALAARTATPILLTEGDRLPDAVADLLTAGRPAEVLVVGGTAAITADVAAEAAALAGGTATRLAGATRYATSVAVAQAGRAAGLTDDAVWVATGLNFPDALAAGPAAALAGSPLLLVDGQDPSGAPASSAWLQDNAVSLVLVGGVSAISDAVAGALAP
ncbi:MAG TPA: cell wall-binding repeat-containing protein [Euzebya sp.]|nr:cell wall-binding repeat-containing protein [Euzebya sp.]